MTDNERIAHYLEANPSRPGLAEVRLKEFGVPVWALIGYMPAVQDDLARVARDYEVPLEAVEAAVAFYRQHPTVIDARIAANNPDFDDILHAI